MFSLSPAIQQWACCGIDFQRWYCRFCWFRRTTGKSRSKYPRICSNDCWCWWWCWRFCWRRIQDGDEKTYEERLSYKVESKSNVQLTLFMQCKILLCFKFPRLQILTFVEFLTFNTGFIPLLCCVGLSLYLAVRKQFDSCFKFWSRKAPKEGKAGRKQP